MSEKRYQTRMHEVLGVEPEERFMYSDYGDREFWLSESGLMYRICDDGTSIPMTQGTLVLFINNPERIVRHTRLTEDQVQALKAATLLGLRYLVKDDDGYVVGYGMEPYKLDDEWFGAHDDEMIFSGIENGAIAGLLSCADSSLLDIVQTLRDAGVDE